MMKKLNTIVTGVAFAASLFAGNALAATDGTLGATSTGTSVVSLTVANRVQITGLSDIALGSWSGTGNMTGSTNYCVYRSGADNYSIKATTDNGAFAVTSATTGDTIPFTAQVSDTVNSVTDVLTYNTATTTALQGSSSLTCGGTSNGQLQVTFAQADLQKASSATDYQATVTLLVQPI